MDDREYLERRAEAELALAQASDHPAVVRAHYMLAGHYLDRLYNPDEQAPDAQAHGAAARAA